MTLSGAMVFVFDFFALMKKKKKKQNESQSVTSNRAQHAKKGIKGRNAEKSRRLQLLLCTKVLALSKEKKNLREK